MERIKTGGRDDPSRTRRIPPNEHDIHTHTKEEEIINQQTKNQRYGNSAKTRGKRDQGNEGL